MISGLLKIKKLHFKKDVFKYRKFYPFYANHDKKTKPKGAVFARADSSYDLKENVYIVNDIPPYFDVIPNQNTPTLNIIEIFQFEGFLANLSNIKNIDTYLKLQMGAKSRSKIRGYKKRLETCFNVKYSFFYGTIDDQEYHFLFEVFKHLIEKRFEQRGGTHESLRNWSTIERETLSMIRDKKASLFVIYNNEKPIDICLNYHYKNVYYNAIRSYDIDYSKFRLGYIDIMVQLDWCFANNYQFFDLGRGDLEYKRRWCNEAYKFKQHVIYDKRFLSKRLTAILISKMIMFKTFLKKKKVQLIPQNTKPALSKKTKAISKTVLKKMVDKLIIDPNDSIDYSDEKYAFLRNYIYDFQYLNFEKSKNIRLYHYKKEKDSYYIQGKSKNLLITIRQND